MNEKEEQYYKFLTGKSTFIPKPIIKKDYYFAFLCGMDVQIPKPITREELYLARLCKQKKERDGQ